MESITREELVLRDISGRVEESARWQGVVWFWQQCPSGCRDQEVVRNDSYIEGAFMSQLHVQLIYWELLVVHVTSYTVKIYNKMSTDCTTGKSTAPAQEATGVWFM